MRWSCVERGSVRSLTVSLHVAAILAAGSIFSASVAVADYTACTLPRPACTAYQGQPRPAVIYLKDFNCPSEQNPPGSGADTTCWQAALDCAYDANSGRFGTVVATQGVQYKIDGTLCVHTAFGGIIDGNTAELYWTGPNSIDSPMWFLADTQLMAIKNLTISSRVELPLFTAVEFTNPANTNGVAPSQNIIDHVRINGITTGGLNYGVRFSYRPGYSIDNNNDLSIIKDTQILGYSLSAISIEHSQSQYHRFINVGATAAGGAPVPPCSSFVSNHDVRLPNDGCVPIYNGGGSFTVVDYSGGGNTNADYDLTAGIAGNILIVHHNSEGSNRMIRAEGVSGASHPVQIIGGRFAANALNADGQWIKFVRRGPLSVDGVILDGWYLPVGVVPKINFTPPVDPTYSGETLTVRGVLFSFPNSADSNPIDLGTATGVTVNASGNLCSGADGGTKPCRGYAAGILGSTGTPFAELDSRPNGHLAYCSDCQASTSTGICASGGSGAFARRVGGVWKCDGSEVMLAGTQTISNKTLDSSNTFPGSLATTSTVQTLTNKDLTTGNSFPPSLATLSGTQTLTNKTLTDSSNVFPQTSAFAFSFPTTISAQSWFGPNTGNKGATADSISVPVPAMTAKSLWCKLGTAPGNSKTWTLTAQTGSGNGTTLLSCAITGSSATTCNTSGSVAFTAGSNLSLRATPTSSPAATTVFCSLGVSPG